MKNVFSFFGITVIIGFSCIACGLSDPKSFYGTWENVRDSGAMNVTLSKESWVGRYENGDNYAIDQLSWVPAKNDDPATKGEYPKGYYITGTASQVYNISNLSRGQQQAYIIYLNKNKTAFLRKQQNASDYVFTKTGDLINNPALKG